MAVNSSGSAQSSEPVDVNENLNFRMPDEVMQLLSEEYARVTSQLQSQLDEFKKHQNFAKELHADVRMLEKKLKKIYLTQERYEQNFQLAQASLNQGDFTSLCAFAGRSMESLEEWHANFMAMEKDFRAIAAKVRSAAGEAVEEKQKALDARDRALWRRKIAEQIRTVLAKIAPVALKCGEATAVTLIVGAGVAGAIANPAGAITLVVGGGAATAGVGLVLLGAVKGRDELLERVLKPLWQSFVASGVGRSIIQAVKEAALLIWHIGTILISIPGVPLQMTLKQLLKVVTWLRNLWSREAEAYDTVAQEFGKLEKHLNEWADHLDRAADSCAAAAQVCDEMQDLTQKMEILANEAAKDQEDLQGTSAPMLTSQLNTLSTTLKENLTVLQQHHGQAMSVTDTALQSAQSVDLARLIHDHGLGNSSSSEP